MILHIRQKPFVQELLNRFEAGEPLDTIFTIKPKDVKDIKTLTLAGLFSLDTRMNRFRIEPGYRTIEQIRNLLESRDVKPLK